MQRINHTKEISIVPFAYVVNYYDKSYDKHKILMTSHTKSVNKKTGTCTNKIDKLCYSYYTIAEEMEVLIH